MSGDLRSRFQMGRVREQRAANPGGVEGVEVKTLRLTETKFGILSDPMAFGRAE